MFTTKSFPYLTHDKIIPDKYLLYFQGQISQLVNTGSDNLTIDLRKHKH